MMRMSFRFIAVIILSLFQVFLSFADGFSGGGRGMSGSPAEGKRQSPEKSRAQYSESGSERRNSPAFVALTLRQAGTQSPSLLKL